VESQNDQLVRLIAGANGQIYSTQCYKTSLFSTRNERLDSKRDQDRTHVHIYGAGGRLLHIGAEWVTTHRLGSVVRKGATNYKYATYGQEIGGGTANDTVKFATYICNSVSGLDYSFSRYYKPEWGRFTSPDPDQASGGPGDPGSCNRYAYLGGDPVNFDGPPGLFASAITAECQVNLTIINITNVAVGLFGPTGTMPAPEVWDSEPVPIVNGGDIRVAIDHGVALALQSQVNARTMSDCGALATFFERLAPHTGIDMLSPMPVFIAASRSAYKVPGMAHLLPPSADPICFTPVTSGPRHRYQNSSGNSHVEHDYHFSPVFSIRYKSFSFVGAVAAVGFEILSVEQGLSRSDISLGLHAARMAQDLRWGRINLQDLGSEIRQNLCK